MSTFISIQLTPPLGSISTVNLFAQPSGQQIGTNVSTTTLLNPVQYPVPDGTTSVDFVSNSGPCIGQIFNLPVSYPISTTTTTTTTTTSTTTTTTTTAALCIPTGDIQTINSSPDCLTSSTWQQRIRLTGYPSVGNKYTIIVGTNVITHNVTSPSETNQSIATSLDSMINALPTLSRQSTGCSTTVTITSSIDIVPNTPNNYYDILIFIDSQHSVLTSYECSNSSNNLIITYFCDISDGDTITVSNVNLTGLPYFIIPGPIQISSAEIITDGVLAETTIDFYCSPGTMMFIEISDDNNNVIFTSELIGGNNITYVHDANGVTKELNIISYTLV